MISVYSFKYHYIGLLGKHLLTPDLDYSKDLRTLRKLEPVSIQWKDCIRIMTKSRDLTLKEQIISTLKKPTGKGNR